MHQIYNQWTFIENEVCQGMSGKKIIASFIIFICLSNYLYSGADQDFQKLSFSHKRGFYQDNFDLTISTTPPGLLIKYTKDGTNPITSPGAIESLSPVIINVDPANTKDRDLAPGFCVRAVAYENDSVACDVQTHTYLFVDRVVELSPDGSRPGTGWLPTNNGRQDINYGMDPQVCNSVRYRGMIVPALLDIPTFSMVMDLDDLFDWGTGIYVNAGEHGDEWERPCSIELINPDGHDGFQINCGVRIRGGYSRNSNNPKRAFRWFFRKEYGAAKLEYPLFGDEGVAEFDKMDLRTSMNYSWSYDGSNLNTMNRDVFSRDLQRDMGQAYTRSRYYHLYINGTYWGLYQTQERSEASFASNYFGGNREDYDVIKVDAGYGRTYNIEATDGDTNAWRRLWDASIEGFENNENYFKVQGKNPDGTRNPDYEVLLDVDNLIDFMLNVFLTGDYDSPVSNFSGNENPNNFYAIYNKVAADRGFIFFRHDAEHSLRDHSWGVDRTGPFPAGSRFEKSNPQWIFQQLTRNPLFRAQIADRVYTYFFADGALTPQTNINRFLARSQEIDLAIIAESARWGDSKREPAFTKDNAWIPAVDWIVDSFFPPRTETVLNQIKAKGWFPQVLPPLYNAKSGKVDKGFSLTIQAPQGKIYYTTNGSDPFVPELGDDATVMLVNENSNKRVLVPTSTVVSSWRRSLDFDDSGWQSGTQGVGYERGSGYQNNIGIDVGGDMYEKQTSCYIRIPFSVSEANVEEISMLTLGMLYDDGFVVYLNGLEALQSGAPSPLRWDSASEQSHEADGWETFSLTDYVSRLNVGDNLLAIHGLNVNNTSSDFIISAQLMGGSSSSTGVVSKDAVEYSSPIIVDSTMVVKARVLYENNWSAAHQIKLWIVQGLDNLKVTEIHYHPLDNGDNNDGEYEFIELKNIGDVTLDLSGIYFSRGIQFTFPENTKIEPDQFLVLASNVEEFSQRYGKLAFGQFVGQLDNNGETIALNTAENDTLFKISYNDKYPWPLSADGGGYSLTSNETNPIRDQDNSANWMASKIIHGTPGYHNISTSVVENGDFLPKELVLRQNYPNPFNPSTTIQFELSKPGFFTLQIYNVLGQQVATLLAKNLEAGVHSVLWDASLFAGGIYFYRLNSKDQNSSKTKKLVLLK